MNDGILKNTKSKNNSFLIEHNCELMWNKDASNGKLNVVITLKYEPRQDISNNVVCATSKASN